MDLCFLFDVSTTQPAFSTATHTTTPRSIFAGNRLIFFFFLPRLKGFIVGLGGNNLVAAKNNRKQPKPSQQDHWPTSAPI